MEPMSENRVRSFGNAVKRILSSAKGVAAIATTLASIPVAVGSTKSYFSGNLPAKDYYDILKYTLSVVAGSWGLYIVGIAYEDGQEKSGPKQQLAIGTDAQANSVKITEVNPLPDMPIPSDRVDTEPQSPLAKK